MCINLEGAHRLLFKQTFCDLWLEMTIFSVLLESYIAENEKVSLKNMDKSAGGLFYNTALVLSRRDIGKQQGTSYQYSWCLGHDSNHRPN